MNKNLQTALGALLILMGLIWTLQGVGIVGGSVMTGKTIWAIIGPVVALLGLLMVAGVVRARRR